jgi:hypothetical protein
VFSCLSGILGVAVVAWYGFAEQSSGSQGEDQKQGQEQVTGTEAAENVGVGSEGMVPAGGINHNREER